MEMEPPGRKGFDISEKVALWGVFPEFIIHIDTDFCIILRFIMKKFLILSMDSRGASKKDVK